MKIYYDPNFTLNELLEYHAPMIVELESGLFVDLHSLNIVNLLGHIPDRKAITEFRGLVLGYAEFRSLDQSLILEELIEFSEQALEKFRISNFLSLKHLQYEMQQERRLLKIENAIDNLYGLVSLCTEFALQNRRFFEDKKFEILLEILTLLELRKLVESYGLSMQMPQPFLFQIDFSDTKLEVVHQFTSAVEKVSKKLTSRIAELYETSKEKILILDKLFSSVDRRSLTKVLYTFTSINEIISDLLYLKELITSFEDFFNSEGKTEEPEV